MKNMCIKRILKNALAVFFCLTILLTGIMSDAGLPDVQAAGPESTGIVQEFLAGELEETGEENRIRAAADLEYGPNGAVMTNNAHGQMYYRSFGFFVVWQGYHSNPLYSYLVANEDGTFTRVEAVSDCIVVENYTADYQFVNTVAIIDEELPLFGGFYAGSDANYIVFGQTNEEESDAKEVLRIVKYSKSWERLGSAGVYGANTYIPFDAGSLRMCEYENILYIRTCHEMYETSDGLHHQANMSLAVDTDSMTVMDCFNKIANIGIGYVSHSFNQFIKVVDGKVVALDHGDAYPRAFVLGQYSDPASEGKVSGSYKRVNIMTFPGEVGANHTGATAGGFEVSDTHYLVAGTSLPAGASLSGNAGHNLFIAAQPIDNFEESATTITWLTDYTVDSGYRASTPQLVELDKDNYALIWEEIAVNGANYTFTNKFRVVLLDGQGNPTGEVQEYDGRLSECQPIYIHNRVVWYSAENEEPVFHEVGINWINGRAVIRKPGEPVIVIDPEKAAQVEAFVKRMYTVALNRDYDPVGLKDWTNWLLLHEVDGAGISNGFINSTEFHNRNLSDSDYVDVLYRTFFDREADAGGKETWMEILADDYPRNYVLAGFVNSVEFDTLCKEYGIDRGIFELPQEDADLVAQIGIKKFVLRLYEKALGRAGEAEGVNNWAEYIQKKIMTAEEVAKHFIISEEFENRKLNDEKYIEVLYETFLGRVSDEAGKKVWLDEIAKGVSREQILEGFSQSNEFKAIMASYGL